MSYCIDSLQVEASKEKIQELTENNTHLQLEATELKTLISQKETTLADLSSKMDCLRGDLDDKQHQLKEKQADTSINNLQVNCDQLQAELQKFKASYFTL